MPIGGKDREAAEAEAEIGLIPAFLAAQHKFLKNRFHGNGCFIERGWTKMPLVMFQITELGLIQA